MRKTILAGTLMAVGVLAACASAHPKDPTLGLRTLDAVVIERQQVPSRSGGSDDYYMVFEAREGQATSRYHLEVTRTQWFRFAEGSHVRITLNNNILTDIRARE
jgi:hypothetical protein